MECSDGPQETNRLDARLIGALGQRVMDALAAPDVVEVMVNADGRLWLETHDGMSATEVVFSRPERQQIIALVANSMDLSSDIGSLAADFPKITNNAEAGMADRFQAMLPPVAEAEMFVIRRHGGRVVPLDSYVENSIMTATQAATIRSAIEHRKNIVIAGGTGSGKTTLASAILTEPGYTRGRLGVIEDRRELHCSASNNFRLLASKAKGIRELVADSLRMRPDRIVVGEVRDGAALDALKAWNTGHPGGVLTLHADGCMESLERLEDLILEVSASPLPRLIGRAVDLIIHICGRGSCRRVESMVRVFGWSGTRYEVEELT